MQHTHTHTLSHTFTQQRKQQTYSNPSVNTGVAKVLYVLQKRTRQNPVAFLVVCYFCDKVLDLMHFKKIIITKIEPTKTEVYKFNIVFNRGFEIRRGDQLNHVLFE